MHAKGPLKAAVIVGLLLAASLRPASAAGTRTYELKWNIQVEKMPDGAGEARVWIAIPQALPEQRVSQLKVDTKSPWKLVEDPTFHNKVVEVTVAKPAAPLTIALSAHVDRDPVDAPRKAELTPEERALYLRKEALVSLSPRIQALADSVGGTSRSRYDYVLAKMDYDKTTPGWGRGDSERACDVGKGNCTDFHSLFMSLERAEKVPALFEMGYPTLAAGEKDKVGGYHCWAWFYDDGAKGWVPVDISEADKHPEKTEFFYGHLDADRITFSRGRDVTLPDMKGAPLNYLPSGAYVEVDGKPLDEGVTRAITYTVVGS
ncbi:MAG: transglutaminase domain-containing protein [bacterium]